MCDYRDHSFRLRGWDYTNPGIYFVTIRTDAGICWFGKVKNRKIILSELGKIANQYWNDIPRHHKNIQLDKYVIMPNHLHCIIMINGQGIYKINKTSGESCRDVACYVPTYKTNAQNPDAFNGRMSKISPKQGSLSVIIRSYKSAVTRFAHNNDLSDFKWQTRYYDHIIKNDNELKAIDRYICNNPVKWIKKYE